MTRENPPERCRGETENERESGCRNRKRRRNSIDTAVSMPTETSKTATRKYNLI